MVKISNTLEGFLLLFPLLKITLYLLRLISVSLSNLLLPSLLENWIKDTEHGPAHQNKTQFPPQSVSPIRKFP